MNIFDKVIRLPSEVVIRRQNSRFLFLNPSIPDWLVTNLNGASALKLCNGKRRVREIEAILSKALGRDTSKEIRDFLSRIINESRLLQSSSIEDFSYQPNTLGTIHLNLTSRCNLKCIHCYAEERTVQKDKLSLSEYVNTIDSINRINKSVAFVFTGGEPLLSEFLFDLAEYAKERGNKLHLLTNGTLINVQNAKRISQLFNLIRISLDGSSPEINDAQRGKGTFDKISRGIDLLVRANAPLKISMTVTKINIKDVSHMFDRFGSLLSFAPLFHAGRARGEKSISTLGKEYYRALSSINGVNPLSYINPLLEKAKKHRIMKCAMGDAEISISESGDVYPCHLLHLPQFKAGNVREKTIEEIYYESDILKRCRELTVLHIRRCRKCELRFICGGACRARAFYEKGKIDVSDDFCEYEKLAITDGIFKEYQLTT